MMVATRTATLDVNGQPAIVREGETDCARGTR